MKEHDPIFVKISKIVWGLLIGRVHVLNSLCAVVFSPWSCEFEALPPARGALSYTLHLLCILTVCVLPRHWGRLAGQSTGIQSWASPKLITASCHGPPQVSLLLDNGPSVARWDSDTSFFIHRQAYSSSEVTPPPTSKPKTDGTKKYTLLSLEQLIRVNTGEDMPSCFFSFRLTRARQLDINRRRNIYLICYYNILLLIVFVTHI